MEEDKKKKKNRKKKNKQATKPIEGVTLDAGESTSNDQSHDLELEKNNNGQVLGIVDETNDVGGDLHANRDGHGPLANGTGGANLAEVEKQNWLDREASFQETIKELQAEKDAQIEKEASTEERIKQLLKEKEETSQKELAGQKEKIKQLHDEKNASMKNEASLKEKLVQLEKENGALILKEGSFQQKTQQIQGEFDAHRQREARLETEIQQLKDEKDFWVQKEDSLKEKLLQLEKENDALILREGSLQQQIQQIQEEIDAHLEKEASLETEIQQLKDEKDSWTQKEAGFEEKINQLVDEAALLNLKTVSWQEKIIQMESERDVWILKEDSAKESITSLTNDNTNLRVQVMELEQSRESLLEETQHLTEIVSSLKLQINNLESSADFPHSSIDNKVTSEDGKGNHHKEGARAPVGKSNVNNSELVGKVNELYAELDQRVVETGHFSSASSVPVAVTDIDGDLALAHDLAVGADDRRSSFQATDSISEASNIMPISGSTQSLKDLMVEDQKNRELVNVSEGPGLANSSEIIEADEIVQIPLDENEMKEPVLEVAENDEKDDVALTDAPLIGAPFRIISFFARYVSGADLVEKNTGRYG